MIHNDFFFLCAELAKEEQDQTFRAGNITPDGFIDEDFEEELGSPSQVGGSMLAWLVSLDELCVLRCPSPMYTCSVGITIKRRFASSK
jgi:hypothetical protein